MRDNGSITLRGLVLGVDHKSGTSKAGQPYSFFVVSVLTGKTVSELTWRDGGDFGPPPKEDEHLNCEVELGIYAGRQQIEVLRVLPSALVGARASSTA